MTNYKLTVAFLIALFLFSCKDDSDKEPPIVDVLLPVENAEYAVLDQVVIQAQVSDNKIIERVQVSLISEDTRNAVLPAVDLTIGQKEYLVDFVFEIADSLLRTGRYFFKVEAFDGNNRASSFRYINIRGMNSAKTGVFVFCENSNTSDLFFDQNEFNFSRIHQFPGVYGGSVFNRYDQQLWYIPSNGNQIEMFDTEKGFVDFSQVFNSGFSNPFGSLKKDERDVRFTVLDIGVKGFNQNQNENYTYLTAPTKRVESLALGEQFNVVEEVNRDGSNRVLKVLNATSGADLRSRTIFEDVVDMRFIDSENVLVFYNNQQGGGALLFNSITSVIQTNLFSSDSIRQVIVTNIGDFVISTKSKVETFRPSNQNLASYLSVAEAVLAYDELNNQVYVGFGNQLRVYNYRQVAPVGIVTMPNSISGIVVKYNQF